MSSVNFAPARMTTMRFPNETVNNQAAIIQDFMLGGDCKKITFFAHILSQKQRLLLGPINTLMNKSFII